jgi:hypothetical protein
MNAVAHDIAQQVIEGSDNPEAAAEMADVIIGMAQYQVDQGERTEEEVIEVLTKVINIAIE